MTWLLVAALLHAAEANLYAPLEQSIHRARHAPGASANQGIGAAEASLSSLREEAEWLQEAEDPLEMGTLVSNLRARMREAIARLDIATSEATEAALREDAAAVGRLLAQPVPHEELDVEVGARLPVPHDEAVGVERDEADPRRVRARPVVVRA